MMDVAKDAPTGVVSFFALVGSLSLALGGFAVEGGVLVGRLLVAFLGVFLLFGEAGCRGREVLLLLVRAVGSGAV